MKMWWKQNIYFNQPLMRNIFKLGYKEFNKNII